MTRDATGTYRTLPRRLGLILVLFALFVAGVVTVSVLDFLDRRDQALTSLRMLMVGTWLLLLWNWLSERTVISPDGIEVKRNFRWRRLRWDEVRSIEEPTVWDLETNSLKLTTATGDRISTHVPNRLREELAAYADAHRTEASAGP